MIRSMTGFGKGEYRGTLGTATVEIRSFNHKFLDIASKTPERCPSEIEMAVRALIQRHIKRGKINITLNYERHAKGGFGFSINRELARHYYRELNGLKEALGARGELGIKDIILLPNVLVPQDMLYGNKILPDVKKATIKALSNLIKMRSNEGSILCKDLIKRAKIIEDMLSKIRERIPLIVDEYKKRLKKNIERLSGSQVPENDKKLVTELAIFANNLDITEELTRVFCHIRGLRQILSKKKGESGKALDFIAQELLREANTIGAKAEDYKVSEFIIKVKEEIEKIREQVQNVE